MPVEILLIEDNGADVRIIKEIVSHSTVAVRITVAKDGENALALLGDPLYKPSLVITDMILPKISGTELLERCKADEIPVVVFSASKNPSDIAKALEFGAKEFVEKPPDLDSYTDAIWKMIWKWVQPRA
jgi:CheY-like chemotaxis protein